MSTLHPWANNIDVSPQDTSTYTRLPSSVLTGSLAGVSWRWKHSHEWLHYSPKDLEHQVHAKVQALGGSPSIASILSAAAQRITTWMVLVSKCPDATVARDLGLIPILPEVGSSIARPVSQATTAFVTATTNLLLMDIIFWYLDSCPIPPNLPPIHSIYAGAPVGESRNAQKLPPNVCSRLQSWEQAIIPSAQIRTIALSVYQDIGSGLGNGLAYIIEHTSGQANWGKVLCNIAAAALGIRLLLSQESELSTLVKIDANRVLTTACSISPIALLLPEVLSPRKNEVSRYEWCMMWRYGQPLCTARSYDPWTIYMERTIWNLLFEINTGEKESLQPSRGAAETPFSTIMTMARVDIHHVQDIILSAIDHFPDLQGPSPPNQTSPKQLQKEKSPSTDHRHADAEKWKQQSEQMEELYKSTRQELEALRAWINSPHSQRNIPSLDLSSMIDLEPKQPQPTSPYSPHAQVPAPDSDPATQSTTAEIALTMAKEVTLSFSESPDATSKPAPTLQPGHSSTHSLNQSSSSSFDQGIKPPLHPLVSALSNPALIPLTPVADYHENLNMLPIRHPEGQENLPREEAHAGEATEMSKEPQWSNAHSPLKETSQATESRRSAITRSTTAHIMHDDQSHEGSHPTGELKKHNGGMTAGNIRKRRGLDDDKATKRPPKRGRTDPQSKINKSSQIEKLLNANPFKNDSSLDLIPKLSPFNPCQTEDKDDEDSTLPCGDKRPSQYRDWQELFKILLLEHHQLLTSPNREADSPSFLKVLSASKAMALNETELTAIFRKQAILVIGNPGTQTWSSHNTASILQLRASTRVPAHVLSGCTLEEPQVIRSTTIGDVVHEGLSFNHRSLNVLSIPLTSPSNVLHCEQVLDSDTCSWNSTTTETEAIIPSIPPKTKWWGMLTLSGCIHPPHIDANGLCTSMTVNVGYKVFVVSTDPSSFSLVRKHPKPWSIEECLLGIGWQIIVIPPGGTLFLPAGHMHFAFTPELEGGNIPGAIARGSHFYNWSRLLDTLRSLFRLQLTQARITNADHSEAWTLLARMLLDLSVQLENGDEGIPAPNDIGPLLVLILRHKDLGFVPETHDYLHTALQIANLHAQIILDWAEQGMPDVYAAWKWENDRLSMWIYNRSDLDPHEQVLLEAASFINVY
ncbi:hypothetical protein BS47DRAFT_1387099 [Hydnum rufescens UP504]|uniref:JmjC domain-containing protein n=1 Tax=Hydnum rufescens UP504 TaxID=1448309 RepID=A0A9P6B9Y3_9AGAM|nr:hypothetical protein BS47DRAFT_1387099 [Hydnum rufescens UP504]